MFSHYTTSTTGNSESTSTTTTGADDDDCHNESCPTPAGCNIPRSQCTISPSVVLISIFDKTQCVIFNIASGFIADASRGLVVTSSHIFNTQSINYPFLIALNAGDEAKLSYRYYARAISKHMTACCLCITHVFDSTIDIHRRRVVVHNHDRSWWSSTLPLSLSTVRALYLVQPVTQMHLHQLLELCISETLDIGQRVFVIGYNSQCKGPFCMAYGHYCCYTLEPPMGKVLTPYEITIRSSKNRHMDQRDMELIGGPCICAEGRVIGIVIGLGRDHEHHHGHFHTVVTSVPVIESVLELAQRKYDAASTMC